MMQEHSTEISLWLSHKTESFLLPSLIF